MAAKQAPEIPPAQKVKTTFQRLTLAATNLNTASDELGKAISVWDAALQKLNLGISAWVEVCGNNGYGKDERQWWSREIGYAKVNEKWGIALRTAEGYYGFEENDLVQAWLFNEAPRSMRIESIVKLPELLEALLKQAEDTTKGIIKKTTQALELAAAMNEPEKAASAALEQCAAISDVLISNSFNAGADMNLAVAEAAAKAFQLDDAALETLNSVSSIQTAMNEHIAAMEKAGKSSTRK